MRGKDLQLIQPSDLTLSSETNQTLFLWKDLLVPSDVTLVTSQWKLGKTTLLLGLIHAMDQSAPFLEQATRRAQTWIVSEESRNQWAERQQQQPLGDHVHLMCRPFASRPTFEEWNDLIRMAADAAVAKTLDLFVIDPLASFLPGRCESNAAVLLEALAPLHLLTDAGAAVLLLHHPKKNAPKEGSLARGSGAMLGFVDVSLELTKYAGMKTDSHCRTIQIQSRHRTTLTTIDYEMDPASMVFTRIHDRKTAQFEGHLALFLSQFKDRIEAATLGELRERWPADEPFPPTSTLYYWAQSAVEKGHLRREGYGTRSSPYRYRLPNKHDEYYDRGERPPPGLRP
jgi:AAA domain